MFLESLDSMQLFMFTKLNLDTADKPREDGGVSARGSEGCVVSLFLMGAHAAKISAIIVQKGSFLPTNFSCKPSGEAKQYIISLVLLSLVF
jgi:hypothetical protein